MNLINALPPVTRISGLAGNQTIQITFNPALSPQVRAQIATQPLTLTVSNSAGTQLTFTSPTGATFTATVSPPLPVGTQLQLSVSDLLPQIPSTPGKPFPTPTSGTPQPATPNTSITIQAKILPTPGNPLPPTGTNPVATPSTIPTQPVPTPPNLPAPGSLTLPANTSTTTLQNLITTTLLQTTATQPPAQPSTLPVPAGPVAATLPTNLPTAILEQPLLLTPTTPMLPDGSQKALLATPTGTPITVTLNLGVALPIAKPQQAMLLPPITQPNQPQQNSPQPILFLTGTSTGLPTPPQPNLQFQVPEEAPQASQTTSPIPTPNAQLLTPVSARILPPQPTDTPGTQTALLATGATVILKSPQPLPTGSIIVADLPITPTTGIQRIMPAETQSQPQPNTAQQTQTAAPITPHTTQAVLAPGMVIQGTITGQNEQGQPLLTITQPGTLAGQTVPLTLSENTTLLPVGAQLNIRVENNLAATILTLTLPPQTQSAFTVGTLGGRWEGLQQALSVLQQQAPGQAANLRAALPQLSNLMPGLIAFTNALRTNDPDDVFDAQTTKLLKSLGIDLSSDISQLSQLQQRPATHADTQWRGTLFPYVEAPNEDPRQGGFFWRREKSDNPRAPTNTRFVVEVEMSQMGPMQLDGLVTYPEIWLKLRRTSAPEPGFTEGLQALVNNLLQTSGLQGGISVENTTTFPVNPRAELLAQTDNPLPTTA